MLLINIFVRFIGVLITVIVNDDLNNNIAEHHLKRGLTMDWDSATCATLTVLSLLVSAKLF